MKAKDYLMQIRLLDVRIDANIEELERLKAMATKVTSALQGDVVSRSRGADTMANAVAKIISLQETINRDVDAYVDLKQAALDLLSKVDNPTHYSILYGRYILYKTWEQIACDIGFTYQWVCQLHGVALQEFEKRLEQ